MIVGFLPHISLKVLGAIDSLEPPVSGESKEEVTDEYTISWS
jgi:hypothetical protein